MVVRGRRVLATTVALGLVAGMLGVTASPAIAASCLVRNPDQRATYTGLARAIREARKDDTLRVSGRCIGSFTVSKRLTLRGVATTESPHPTLYGKDGATVLSVEKRVLVLDLRITGATAASGSGSGIVNSGSLTLAGTTSVVGNSSYSNGGGIQNSGVLVMQDQVTVTANSSSYAAGIYNSGTLRLTGTASVMGNTAPYGAAGMFNAGTVDLYDSSSIKDNIGGSDAGGGMWNSGGTVNLRDASVVSGNSAGNYGGGVFEDINSAGSINLFGSASITGNSAAVSGGGIGLQFTSAATVTTDPGWTGVVSGNSPDNCDPDNVITGCT
jgi:hypothetical protein